MYSLFALFALLIGGLSWLGRAAMGGDKALITRKIAASGGKVIWIKRLDSQSDAPTSFGATSVTTMYDVLVERDGLRAIEVWRVGLDGAFRN